MGSVVIGEFGEIEEIRPIGLKVVCVRAEVVFDGLIGPFSLTVCLWVEGGGESKAGAKEGSEFFPPGGGECCSSVGYDMVGETV